MADYEIPGDLHFTREDEWLRREDDQWVIGVSDYAQQQLGDIVFVELPAIGTALTRGESFGVIESVKAVSDLYAPISGKVVAINEELEERPEVVNENCYHDGWLIAIEGAEAEEIETLMNADAYKQFVEGRSD